MSQNNLDLQSRTPTDVTNLLRKTGQWLLPVSLAGREHGQYNLYPSHDLGAGMVFEGYDSLACWMADYQNIHLEGYGGVYWELLRAGLTAAFDQQRIKVNWIDINRALKQEPALEILVAPYLGSPEAVWGTKTKLTLRDFFTTETLEQLHPDPGFELNIIYGTGASLVKWTNAVTVYCDVPKNEIQYRMRTGRVFNLGKNKSEDNVAMYKRCYFVDWVVLNNYKQEILNQIAVIADVQSLDTLTWATATAVYRGLKEQSATLFRVRPWFEPGVWGGQWMKTHLPALNQEELNYAWSFELIVPENGLIFTSEQLLLEVSFDFLMFQHSSEVLGVHAEQYGAEFPIRFDFLDTFDGGDLSIQCHPSLTYIQEEFGENITQDETYYILDAKEDAQVYLGFQEDINAAVFKEVLEDSQLNQNPVAIEQFVQVHSAKKHDLFLIPNGTVHSAGKNNLVLEISATPYIFTFKMYDWLRLGMDGKPRPINIAHAFKNLDFDRKGDLVAKELISSAQVIEEGADWCLYHLPTHAAHFYAIHRIEFETIMEINTQNVCHVLMLVEGSSLRIELSDGTIEKFNYAETFVVPAAAKSYKLYNVGAAKAKVIKAFLK